MVTKSYETLQQEIEKLQREAEAVRDAEVGEVISRIKAAIEFYGLQPADLFDESGHGRRATKAKSSGAKYANGQGGEWGGRGPRPLWLRDAIAAGHALEEFLVTRS